MDSTEPDANRGFLAEFLATEAERLGPGCRAYWRRGCQLLDATAVHRTFDLTVAAEPDAVFALVRALETQGYQVFRIEEEHSKSGPAFVRLMGAGYPSVDLIVAKTDYQDLVIERAARSDPGVLPVATPEDLIVLKLIANRSIDHRDIFTLVEAQTIDWPYVEKWAEAWQVTDSLANLRKEIADRST